MSTPHISHLRDHLMQTLSALRDRESPMEPDRARAIAQVAGVLVDTARVEVDYIKATKQDRAGFLEEPATPLLPTAHNPFPSATGTPASYVHRLRDDEDEESQ